MGENDKYKSKPVFESNHSLPSYRYSNVFCIKKDENHILRNFFLVKFGKTVWLYYLNYNISNVWLNVNFLD